MKAISFNLYAKLNDYCKMRVKRIVYDYSDLKKTINKDKLNSLVLLQTDFIFRTYL